MYLRSSGEKGSTALMSHFLLTAPAPAKGVQDTLLPHLGLGLPRPQRGWNPVPQGEHKSRGLGASLMVQWLRICLAMQGTVFQSLVWEEPTPHGATEPLSCN